MMLAEKHMISDLDDTVEKIHESRPRLLWGDKNKHEED
jgi:hypothetical protein